MYGNNISTLTGNLGRDPEIRYFESGNAKAEFSIAVSTGKDKPADWFDVAVWGQSAERAMKLLHKGSRVVVIGSLKQERWQDRETQCANRCKGCFERCERRSNRKSTQQRTQQRKH